MAKSALELLDSPVVGKEVKVEGSGTKSAMSLLEPTTTVTKTTPTEPQRSDNVESYDPIAMFSKLVPKVPEEPTPPEPPKLEQGGRLGEVQAQTRANDLAFDVLRNRYPIASTSYLLQATRNMGGVNIKKASPDLADAIKAGFRQSVMGKRGVAIGYKEPYELSKEQYDSLSGPAKFAYSLAAFGGDLPAFMLGGLVGSTAGPLGAMAGAFGTAEGLRAYYDQLIEKGEANNPIEFLRYVNKVAEAELKGMVTGKLTGAAGSVGASAAGAAGKLVAEAATLTTVPSILEGRLPTTEDYYNTASFLLGMNLLTKGPATIRKMRKLFVKTGMTPKDIIEEVKTNPELEKALKDDSTEIPQEIVDKAKAKVEEAAKVQADLAAAEKVAKNPPTPEEVVKEELRTKAKKVKEIKTVRVEDLIKEGKVTVIKEGKKSVQPLNGLDEQPAKSATTLLEPEPVKTKVVKRKDGKVATVKEPPKAEQPQPITDTDLQTGTPLPKALSPAEHPFRDKSPEHTNEMSKLYVERIKNADVDPEVFTRYLINEVNRYLNGEDPATPIEKIRDGLSRAAVNAEKMRFKFESTKAFEEWKDTISEAARWARESDRLTNKPTGGTQLNMMIPVNELPQRVKELFKTLKVGFSKGENTLGDVLHRNKEIFDKTGFWLGRDNKWRYEIDDSQTKYHPPKAVRELYAAEGFVSVPLKDVISNPELFERVPELNDIFIRYRKDLNSQGSYATSADLKTIDIKSIGDKSTAIHEIQHAVNDIVGSKFRGSNVEVEKAKIDKDIFLRLNAAVKTKEVRDILDGIIQDYIKGKQSRNKLEVAMHDMLDASKDPHEANAIAGALRDFINADAFENYKKDPGEMEARLASARMEMSVEERRRMPPWETLEKMLASEGMKEFSEYTPSGDKITRSVRGPGSTLYTGIDPTQIPEATRKIIQGAKDFMSYMENARGMKAFKPGEAIDQVRQELVRSFVDRSGNIRKELLDNLGDRGYEVVQKAVLVKGASSLAAQNLKQMQKEVYDGLSRKEKTILDSLILADRMADIASYKNNFKFPEGISTDGKVPDKTIKYRVMFKELEGLTDDRVETLNARAKAYFEWMKKPLQDLLDAELISQEEFNLLSSHNYRRLKLVDIYDKRYQSKLGKKIRTVYDSGVEALAHGRETDVFEPSSEVMALEVFNRAYGRIFNNAANRNLLELAREQKDNPFVAVKDSPKDRIPSGWNPVFVYEKGERKAIYISPEMSQEWINQSPEMSYRMSQFLRWVSGSPLLRTFATGIDWGFALANLPRDVMHIWYAARVFKDGKWDSLYSPTMPVYMGQMAADISGVISDAALRGKKYQDYIKEGGGMEFLVHQGRLLQRGRHVESGMDKVMNFLGYLGETSEIMTRLAVRDRVIKRKAAEKGISYDEAYADAKIRQEATFAARDYMDFGQGGSIAKGLDNALPYLNASIQGTRGLFRAFKDSPWESSYKLAQFATLVTGVYLASQFSNPETMKALKGSLDTQGNLIIPLGDGFGFDDEKGQRHYPYLKIPLDPGQKFFKTFIEGATDKMMGNEVDVKGIVNSLSQVSPVGTSSLPPTIDGVLGYINNQSFWTNEAIWGKTDKALPWPQSKEEFIPGQTPNAMIDIGQLTGLSPERLKYVLSELFTGGSIWGWLVGQGYDAVFHSQPKEKREQHLAMVLSKTPMIRRFFGVTNPYSQFSQKVEDAQNEAMLTRWVENRGLDQVAQAYLFDNVGSRNDVIDYIRQFKDPDTRDRLKERYIFQEKTRDLPNRSFWLSLRSITDTEARARVYADRLERANAKEYGELMEEKRIVQSAGGIFSDEFNHAVSKIRAGVQ